MQRRGGITFLKINGVVQQAKGVATYQVTGVERSTVVGIDGRHGYKEMPIVIPLEIALTDRGDLDLKALALIDNATITLELANGKVVTFRGAFGTGNWDTTTDEGEIKAKFECESVEEVLN